MNPFKRYWTWLSVVLAGGLVLLAPVCPALDFDDEDFGDDEEFSDGDTSCFAPYGSNYYGYILSADGHTNGTVKVREARAARKASSRVTVFLTDWKTGARRNLIAKACKIPTSSVAHADNGSLALPFAIDWESFVGKFEDGTIVMATIAGASKINKIAMDPLIVLKGYHSLAMQVPAAPNQESTTNGFLTVSVNVKAKGRYSATVMMPDGWRFVQSGKMEESDDLWVVRVGKKRRYLGGYESFSFDLHLDPLGADSYVTNVSHWVSTSSKCTFDRKIEAVSIGRSLLTAAEFKGLSVSHGCDEAEIVSSKLASKTGIVTGSFRYPIVNARGKVTKKKGTIRGLDVNGEVYASGYILKTLEFPLVWK